MIEDKSNSDNKLQECENKLQECENKLNKLEGKITDINTHIADITGLKKGWYKIGNIIVAIFIAVLGGGFIFHLLKNENRMTMSEEKYKKLEQDLINVKNELSKSSEKISSVLSNRLSPIVYKNGKFTDGYGMGKALGSGKDKEWITSEDDSLCMNYPAGESWGSVFITIGEPSNITKKLGKDFSQYKTLSVEIKGKQGNESIHLGLRDEDTQKYQSGDTFLIEKIPNYWKNYDIPLEKNNFPNTELRKLYTIASFAFKGQKSQTVCFRTIQYK